MGANVFLYGYICVHTDVHMHILVTISNPQFDSSIETIYASALALNEIYVSNMVAYLMATRN